MAVYRRIQTADADINRMQDSVNTAVQQLSDGPFIGGNQLTKVVVQSTVTSIAHKLSQTPTTVILGPPDGNAAVWMPQSPDSNYIYLQASAACTLFDIWVK